MDFYTEATAHKEFMESRGNDIQAKLREVRAAIKDGFFVVNDSLNIVLPIEGKAPLIIDELSLATIYVDNAEEYERFSKEYEQMKLDRDRKPEDAQMFKEKKKRV